MNILDFPRELQYFILAKLDGFALGRAKCVCHSWREIIGHLESQFNIWLRCCMKEIPSNILVELTGMCRFIEQGEITADVCNRVGWEFWRDLYREYRRSELLKWWQQDKMEITIPFMFGKATSIALAAGGFLVSGHVTGNVLVWENLKATDALTLRVVHKHHHHVSCVKVVAVEKNWTDLGCDERTNSCPCVVSSSRDCVINVSSIHGTDTHHIAHFSQQVNDVSVCGEYFVAAAKSAILHGQPVWRVTSSSPLSLEQTDQLWGQRTSNVTAVGMTFGTVVSGDVCGNLMMWENGEDLREREPEIIYKFNNSIKQICLQGDRLLCLLDDGSLCVKRDLEFKRWATDSLFQTLEGTPKCIALRGTVLAVATSFGGVFLYSVPGRKEWEDLNFLTPDCIIKTGKNTITSLALSDDGRSPVVAVAADDETITVVRWQPT